MKFVADFKMELAFIIFCVYPVLVSSISVSSNGNSPKIKMLGGMMVDSESQIDSVTQEAVNTEVRKKSNYEKSRKINLNSTKLSANERYRRLIPYMTFYYANDLPTSTTEDNTLRNVEVEKAQIIEAATIERLPKKVYHSSYRNVPRFQGNRVVQYSVASSDPTKLYPTYQVPVRETQNYNHLIFEKTPAEQLFERVPHKYLQKTQLFAPTTKPHYDLYDDNVKFYVANKEQNQATYKLVPYQQTPPVQITHQDNDYNPMMAPPPPAKDTVYLKPRPNYAYDTKYIQQTARKPASVVTEHYYEKLRPEPHKLVPPVIEGGFKPIIRTTEAPLYTTVAPAEDNIDEQVQIVESTPTVNPIAYERPKYYQYVVEKPVHKPAVTNSVTLGDLISSLRINKPVPKPIVKPNMGSSIRTLLQVLNVLRVMPHQNEVDHPVLSTPKPFVNSIVSNKPDLDEPEAIQDGVEFHREPYLADISPPSQHIDEYRISSGGSTTQEFPLKIHSDDDGGTPGRPGVDYPILTTIPPTAFDCKTQRYKGFFADPETRCQVWHYCDLNGGQASFLCPNGTIFSQAGLTCDWWFNVRCASTTQLYVLNESLYKYILPHSPKFPEDYSGPLVDKYLTLKFKEMEEQFRKSKNKQSAEDKEDSEEVEEETSTASEEGESSMDEVSQSSVVIESPGTTGNLHRPQE